METFLQDLRFGIRAAVRTPLFSLLAIMTLALGIGANVALFAIIKPILMDPLPFTEQERLVRIFGHNTESGESQWGLSAGMIDDLKQAQRSFSHTAAFVSFPQEVVVGGTADGRPQVGSALLAEPDFFALLGVNPLLGRTTFRPEELPTSGPGLYVILTYEGWQRYTGGDQEIIGDQISIFEVPRTVVGVLPSGFIGPTGDADIYLPLNLANNLANPIGARRSYSFGMIGRLAPGVSLDSAERELDVIAATIQRDHPDDVRGMRFNPMPLRTAMVGDARLPLLILLASAVLVLVIACTNLAGAMLSRALSRRKEFAVRTVLGAGRGRLVRQLLTESTVIAFAGGLAGTAVAIAALMVVRDVATVHLPYFSTPSLDPGALTAVVALTVLAGLAVGALPALVIGGSNPQKAMTEQTRGATEGRHSGRMRGGLVAAQIALSLGLLVGAGLLGRSLWVMAAMPVGVDASNVATARTTLPLVRYGEPERRIQFQEELLARVRSLPGVTAAATTAYLPQRVANANTFEFEGQPIPIGQAEPWALWNAVSDEYFATLRVPLLHGRVFDSRDSLESPNVVVINETMAQRYFPDGNAVGARMRIGPDRDSPRWEVIGVVGDVRNDPAELVAQPMTYMSHRQEPVTSMRLVARTQADPHGLLGMLEQTLFELDAALPFQEAATLESVLAANLAPRRLPVLLMVGFGALALLLAAVGVYAMFSTIAAARERELGIRVALGASPAAILRLMLGQGAVWLGLGIGFGVLATIAAGFGLRELLFGVSPFDPATVTVATLTLVLAAGLALLAPLRRATRVDPIRVLHSE
jgi:putative ABC transport system permease protein